MRVAVSGSHGLVGSALVAALAREGYDVVLVTRPEAAGAGPGSVIWDPEHGVVEAGPLSKVQAVVHLAGEPIGNRRWTETVKARIRDSRVRGTQALSRAMAAADPKPEVLVSASAIGFYGDRGDEVLTEESPSGEGFFAAVCRKWETATEPAEEAGIRTVHIRTGVVLSKRGGTLERILPLFKLGLGGRLGSGDQWFSWISLDDEVAAILHLLETAGASGAFNLTAPDPVTNRDFTKTLGRVLRRPTVLPVPRPVMRLALGSELADELVLGGQRVLPRRLEDSGFVFTHPDLESALLAAVNEDS